MIRRQLLYFLAIKIDFIGTHTDKHTVRHGMWNKTDKRFIQEVRSCELNYSHNSLSTEF